MTCFVGPGPSAATAPSGRTVLTLPAVPETKSAFALTVVVPPPTGAAIKHGMYRVVVGITDNGTIFFLNDETASRTPSLVKRLPSGEIVTVVAPGNPLPGGGTCLRIGSATLGASGDLVLSLVVAGAPPGAKLPPLLPPARDPLPLDTLTGAPYREWLYFLPRDSPGKPSTLASLVPITAPDEPAPGGGWFYTWKSSPQIAADGTVLLAAIIHAPPARFDAYYVFRPAGKDCPAGALAGPIVSQGDKPLYEGTGTTGFFTLGAPALDEVGNLVFPAEPAAEVPTAAPEFALYRLARSSWEPILPSLSTIAATNMPTFPLPAPIRLVGTREIDLLVHPFLQIEATDIGPSVDSSGNSVIVRTKIKSERSQRFHEVMLGPSGGAPKVRLLAGGLAEGAAGGRWDYLESPIVRAPAGGLFFAGRTESEASNGTPVWNWRPGSGFSIVVRPSMLLGGERVDRIDFPQGRTVNRSGVLAFAYTTMSKTGAISYGIATAAPL